MPAFISLHQVSYRTPDDRSLFNQLDLSFGPVRTGLVGRNGTGKSTLLALIAGEREPASGRVTVEGSVGWLRQQVQPVRDATVADLLGVPDELAALQRLEAGRGTMEEASAADWLLPQRLATALAAAGLSGIEPGRPVGSLSGGQRTRLALATLLFRPPDFLLLDEPTNNLDADGRATIAAVLAGWHGGAIVVSHDRALLRQMDAIVELTSIGATSYGGGYDLYRERKGLELAAVERAAASAERQLDAADRRAQAQAERKSHRDAAGRRKGRDGGLPRIVLGGMQRRAEETAGSQARLASRMVEAASEQAAAARARLEVLQRVTAKLPRTGLAQGKRVLEAHELTGGPEGRPTLISGFELVVIGPERIAITGPNGSGKTTLLRLLTGDLQPTAGSVHRFSRHALLDQTVSLLDPAQTIRENYRRLNPGEDENSCRAALARFKFRADAALQAVVTLSGGEMLRAGLAATIGAIDPPELLILDEPTNHLDFEAIEAVEAGLRGYDGALLVVTHDRDFLEAIGITREEELGGGEAGRWTGAP